MKLIHRQMKITDIKGLTDIKNLLEFVKIKLLIETRLQMIDVVYWQIHLP